MMKETLKIPEENIEIKKKISGFRNEFSTIEAIEYRSLAVWYGNLIPKYLWKNWKDELKKEGWTWQKFLKLLKYLTNYAINYVEGGISWESFVKTVIASLNGELGEAIKKGR